MKTAFIVMALALVAAPASMREALASATASGPALAGTLERVVFHGHATHGISYYCYPRNYWWFYRPYTTANDGYARCMPYFHLVRPPPAASWPLCRFGEYDAPPALGGLVV